MNAARAGGSDPKTLSLSLSPPDAALVVCDFISHNVLIKWFLSSQFTYEPVNLILLCLTHKPVDLIVLFLATKLS